MSVNLLLKFFNVCVCCDKNHGCFYTADVTFISSEGRSQNLPLVLSFFCALFPNLWALYIRDFFSRAWCRPVCTGTPAHNSVLRSAHRTRSLRLSSLTRIPRCPSPACDIVISDGDFKLITCPCLAVVLHTFSGPLQGPRRALLFRRERANGPYAWECFESKPFEWSEIVRRKRFDGVFL